MKRLLFVAFAACVLTLAPTLSTSAMSIPKQSAVISNTDSDIIQVRGHRGGRGHHYGWGRGRGRGHR